MIRRNWKQRLAIVLFLLLFLIVISFSLLQKRASPVLMAYASQKAEKLATFLMNDAISKQVVEELTLDNLFILTKDDSGKIVSIDFNSIIVNKILSTTTNAVVISLKYVEEGKMEKLELSDAISLEYKDQSEKGVFYKIPLGIAFKNPFLAGLGPKIPVLLNLVGSVSSSVETEVTNFGINNAMIEVYIHVITHLQVLLPFVSKNIEVDTLVPIAMKLLQGNVPEYYAGSLDSSILSIPIQ